MQNYTVTTEKSLKFLLNTQIIADEISSKGWKSNLRVSNGTPNLRYFQVYEGDDFLPEDVLYFVPQNYMHSFPADKYSYITCTDLDGKAPHIDSIAEDEITVINTLISIFQKYRDFEIALDNVVIEEKSLNDICKIGEKIFNNPCYIHDRNFSIIGISSRIKGMLEFETSERDGSLHIPLWLIDQFKFDSDYKKTLEQTNASIWGKDQYPHNIRSLYVNILDTGYYYGRFLINEINTPLNAGQFRMAEQFANYVKLIMTREQYFGTQQGALYENAIKSLSAGSKDYSPNDVKAFLGIRSWNEDDEYICLVFQTQDENLSIRSESALRSILLSEFKESYDFIKNQMLCLIINMTSSNIKTTTVRNSIARLVRDSYMYCGISNRISGFMNIATGFKQAEVTLEYVRKHSSQWIQIFVDIALDYALDNIEVGFDTQRLISPHLELLSAYDKEHGTEYFKTLKSYLTHERDIPETSKDLVIHRTTLTHRLEQMKKVTNIDLDDEDKRLYLLISFKLYEKLASKA